MIQKINCSFILSFDSIYTDYSISQCIHLIECFDYQNHICLVSELLSASVFDFLKENSYHPFPFSHIQSFAKQLMKSVTCESFLESLSTRADSKLLVLHSLNLIHTDLKPENILLADASSFEAPPKSSRSSSASSTKARKILKNPDIRLIDFGSATFDNEYHATVVSTRHYRAPEIIFGEDFLFLFWTLLTSS